MRIIPVIDLKAGQVVRGIGGRRSEYRPMVSCLTPSSKPLVLTRALVEKFHPAELYVADLDALAGETPAWVIYEALRTLNISLWIDAGVREAFRAKAMADRGIEGIVCGLETLQGPAVLSDILDTLGPERTIFSLDLRDGRLLGNLEEWSVSDPRDVFALVESVITQGIRQLIILDLARVGEGRGTGSEGLCRSIVMAYTHVRVYVGGGIRGIDDIALLEKAGAAGVLVASALHDGRIAPFGEKPPAIS